MKILLAVDGSIYTKKMLTYLTSHDGMFGSAHDYTVLTVRPGLPARASAMVGKSVVDGYYSDEAEKVLAPVGKFLNRHGIESKSTWKVGHAGETIAKFAHSGKFDLLVLGSHGHGELMTMVMGSVATQVLARCTVPVLLIR